VDYFPPTRVQAFPLDGVDRERPGLRRPDQQAGLDPGRVVPEAPNAGRPPMVTTIATQVADRWEPPAPTGALVAILRRVPYSEAPPTMEGPNLSPGTPTSRNAPPMWERSWLDLSE